MAYSLKIASQYVQIIDDGRIDIARCANTKKGWIAHRVVVQLDGTLRNVGEGIPCSNLINRPDGAARIAEKLGLPV